MTLDTDPAEVLAIQRWDSLIAAGEYLDAQLAIPGKSIGALIERNVRFDLFDARTEEHDVTPIVLTILEIAVWIYALGAVPQIDDDGTTSAPALWAAIQTFRACIGAGVDMDAMTAATTALIDNVWDSVVA